MGLYSILGVILFAIAAFSSSIGLRLRKERLEKWQQSVEKATKKVHEQGPNKVVINWEGEAYRPDRAMSEHGTGYSIVYLRNDGWTLGATKRLKGVAYDMWAGSWVAVMDNAPDGEFVRI